MRLPFVICKDVYSLVHNMLLIFEIAYFSYVDYYCSAKNDGNRNNLKSKK